eukprot:6490592-Amphidinium_carterae.2
MIHGSVDKGPKLAPSMTDCIFLSWHCAPGFIWNDNEVMLVTQGLHVTTGSEVHVHRTKEVESVDGSSFPFAERKFGSGLDEHTEGDSAENTLLRQVQLDEADDRSLKVVGEGLDSASAEGVLSKDQISKGWRIDRFCDRLVRTPPNSSRPACFSPEDWRSLPVKLRRELARREKEKQSEGGSDEGRARGSEEEIRPNAGGDRKAEAEASGSGGVSAATAWADGVCNDMKASNPNNKKRVWFAGDNSVRRRGLVITLDDKTCNKCMELLRNDPNKRVFVEVCCGPNSMLCARSDPSIICVRVTEKEDITNHETLALLTEICEKIRDRVMMWFSVPCTTGCTWHRTRPELTQNPNFARKVRKDRSIAESAYRMLVSARKCDCPFVWEWPKDNDLWRGSVGMKVHQLEGACERIVDGCSIGLSKNGQYMKKPWRLVTDHQRLLEGLRGLRCCGKHVHVQCRGAGATMSGEYTSVLADLVMSAISHDDRSGSRCNKLGSQSPRDKYMLEGASAFDPEPSCEVGLLGRRRCWAATANAIRNSLDYNKPKPCDVDGEEIKVMCEALQCVLADRSLPLSTTRTNIFDREGGNLRGVHFGLQVSRGRGISTKDRDQKNVLRLLLELANTRASGEGFTSVQLNELREGECIKEHADERNDGDSWVISWGDYSGGVLQTLENEVWNEVQTRHTWHCLPEKVRHRVSCVTSGTRYSAVFYTPRGAQCEQCRALLHELRRAGYPISCHEDNTSQIVDAEKQGNFATSAVWNM